MKKSHRDNNSRGAISRRSFIKGASAVAAAASLARVGDAKATAEAAPISGASEVLGPGEVAIELTINGQKKSLAIEPRVTLARAIREHLGMTGTKLVCDRGSCGACTVHIDGKPVVSCMILAVDARGRSITTIEGLSVAASMHPVQHAFVEADALQCGFCTPGMVMSVAAALEANPRASLDDIKHATSGNICRCGTYPHVFAAALNTVSTSRKSGAA